MRSPPEVALIALCGSLTPTAGKLRRTTTTTGGIALRSFQVAESGTYYIGVSGFGNLAYDPIANPAIGDTTLAGLYQLTLARSSGHPLRFADLLGASFQVDSDRVAWGDTLTGTYTVQNNGGADAGAFDVQLWLSDDPQLAGSGVVLDTIHVPGLAADTSTSGSFTVTLPVVQPAGFTTPATAYLGLVVDSTDSVIESIERNNRGQRPGIDMALLHVLTAQIEVEPNNSFDEAAANPLPFGTRTWAH